MLNMGQKPSSQAEAAEEPVREAVLPVRNIKQEPPDEGEPLRQNPTFSTRAIKQEPPDEVDETRTKQVNTNTKASAVPSSSEKPIKREQFRVHGSGDQRAMRAAGKIQPKIKLKVEPPDNGYEPFRPSEDPFDDPDDEDEEDEYDDYGENLIATDRVSLYPTETERNQSINGIIESSPILSSLLSDGPSTYTPSPLTDPLSNRTTSAATHPLIHHREPSSVNQDDGIEPPMTEEQEEAELRELMGACDPNDVAGAMAINEKMGLRKEKEREEEKRKREEEEKERKKKKEEEERMKAVEEERKKKEEEEKKRKEEEERRKKDEEEKKKREEEMKKEEEKKRNEEEERRKNREEQKRREEERKVEEEKKRMEEEERLRKVKEDEERKKKEEEEKRRKEEEENKKNEEHNVKMLAAARIALGQFETMDTTVDARTLAQRKRRERELKEKEEEKQVEEEKRKAEERRRRDEEESERRWASTQEREKNDRDFEMQLKAMNASNREKEKKERERKKKEQEEEEKRKKEEEKKKKREEEEERRQNEASSSSRVMESNEENADLTALMMKMVDDARREGRKIDPIEMQKLALRIAAATPPENLKSEEPPSKKMKNDEEENRRKEREDEERRKKEEEEEEKRRKDEEKKKKIEELEKQGSTSSEGEEKKKKKRGRPPKKKTPHEIAEPVHKKKKKTISTYSGDESESGRSRSTSATPARKDTTVSTSSTTPLAAPAAAASVASRRTSSSSNPAANAASTIKKGPISTPLPPMANKSTVQQQPKVPGQRAKPGHYLPAMDRLGGVDFAGKGKPPISTAGKIPKKSGGEGTQTMERTSLIHKPANRTPLTSSYNAASINPQPPNRSDAPSARMVAAAHAALAAPAAPVGLSAAAVRRSNEGGDMRPTVPQPRDKMKNPLGDSNDTMKNNERGVPPQQHKLRVVEQQAAAAAREGRGEQATDLPRNSTHAVSTTPQYHAFHPLRKTFLTDSNVLRSPNSQSSGSPMSSPFSDGNLHSPSPTAPLTSTDAMPSRPNQLHIDHSRSTSKQSEQQNKDAARAAGAAAAAISAVGISIDTDGEEPPSHVFLSPTGIRPVPPHPDSHRNRRNSSCSNSSAGDAADAAPKQQQPAAAATEQNPIAAVAAMQSPPPAAAATTQMNGIPSRNVVDGRPTDPRRIPKASAAPAAPAASTTAVPQRQPEKVVYTPRPATADPLPSVPVSVPPTVPLPPTVRPHLSPANEAMRSPLCGPPKGRSRWCPKIPPRFQETFTPRQPWIGAREAEDDVKPGIHEEEKDPRRKIRPDPPSWSHFADHVTAFEQETRWKLSEIARGRREEKYYLRLVDREESESHYRRLSAYKRAFEEQGLTYIKGYVDKDAKGYVDMDVYRRTLDGLLEVERDAFKKALDLNRSSSPKPIPKRRVASPPPEFRTTITDVKKDPEAPKDPRLKENRPNEKEIETAENENPFFILSKSHSRDEEDGPSTMQPGFDDGVIPNGVERREERREEESEEERRKEKEMEEEKKREKGRDVIKEIDEMLGNGWMDEGDVDDEEEEEEDEEELAINKKVELEVIAKFIQEKEEREKERMYHPEVEIEMDGPDECIDEEDDEYASDSVDDAVMDEGRAMKAHYQTGIPSLPKLMRQKKAKKMSESDEDDERKEEEGGNNGEEEMKWKDDDYEGRGKSIPAPSDSSPSVNIGNTGSKRESSSSSNGRRVDGTSNGGGTREKDTQMPTDQIIDRVRNIREAKKQASGDHEKTDAPATKKSISPVIPSSRLSTNKSGRRLGPVTQRPKLSSRESSSSIPNESTNPSKSTTRVPPSISSSSLHPPSEPSGRSTSRSSNEENHAQSTVQNQVVSVANDDELFRKNCAAITRHLPKPAVNPPLPYAVPPSISPRPSLSTTVLNPTVPYTPSQSTVFPNPSFPGVLQHTIPPFVPPPIPSYYTAPASQFHPTPTVIPQYIHVPPAPPQPPVISSPPIDGVPIENEEERRKKKFTASNWNTVEGVSTTVEPTKEQPSTSRQSGPGSSQSTRRTSSNVVTGMGGRSVQKTVLSCPYPGWRTMIPFIYDPAWPPTTFEEDRRTLGVCKFPSDTTEEDLKIIFEQFGPVEEVRIKEQKRAGHQIVAFVRFKENNEALLDSAKAARLEMKSMAMNVHEYLSRKGTPPPAHIQ